MRVSLLLLNWSVDSIRMQSDLVAVAFKVGMTEGLCEDVGCVVLSVDSHDLEFTVQNLFPNVVELDADVFDV